MLAKKEKEFEEKIIKIERVAKVVKGGRRFSFNAFAVIGDEKTRVGVGFGKANEVPDAIRKAVDDAKKNIIEISIKNRTIPYPVIGKFKAARVLLKPCSPGTGIIAGDAVRAVVEKAGIHDVLTKSLGSANPLNIVKAAFNGLAKLQNAKSVSKRRGISINQLYGMKPAEKQDSDEQDEIQESQSAGDENG